MTWLVMGIVGAICIIAALVFLGDRRDAENPGAYSNRSGFDSAAGPVNNVLSAPVHVVGDGTSGIDNYFFAVRENRILKKKVAELSQYRDAYVELKDINERYEKLLNLRTEPPVDTVTARSVSVSRGPFTNNRLIDAGADKKISFGNPVITDQGLVGRVVGVSANVSRVLMVTDVTSHVPVMILRSDGRAMMDGDGGGYPKMDWVRGQDTVREGDQILTSGDGGIFPRGLPVGEAVRGVDGVWRVRLYANRAPIDFVKILLFKDFSQLPNADTLLRSPPVSDLLPPPPLPKVEANASASSGSASSSTASQASASTSSTAAKTVAVVKPAITPPVTSTAKPATGTPASATVTKPAATPNKPVAKPKAHKPAGIAGHAISPSDVDTATLKPYVPETKPAGGQNR